MCLTVKYVPISERASNCVPCFKGLCTSWTTGRLITPYMACSIPKSGILVPQSKIAILAFKGKVIGGRAVHARVSREGFLGKIASRQEKAFAFGVVAYGEECDNDLACRLLYMPNLDKTPEKAMRLKAIKRWSKMPEGPTDAQVRKVFPQFQPNK